MSFIHPMSCKLFKWQLPWDSSSWSSTLGATPVAMCSPKGSSSSSSSLRLLNEGRPPDFRSSQSLPQSISQFDLHVHRQFTLLKLSRDFKLCSNLNRECGRVKNRGWSFDCDEKFLNLSHLSMRPAHPNYWPRSSQFCPSSSESIR